MSKPNPKFQTLMQRYGYSDPDLKTPGHDQILFWLKENVAEVVRPLVKFPDWQPDNVSNLRASAKKAIQSRIEFLQEWRDETLSEANGITTRSKAEGNQRYATLSAKAQKIQDEIERLRTLPDLPEPPAPTFKVSETRDERPICTGVGANVIVGFIDAMAWCLHSEFLTYSGGGAQTKWDRSLEGWKDPAWSNKTSEMTIGFEIKTSIPSYGELMRQVNTYRQYFSVGDEANL